MVDPNARHELFDRALQQSGWTVQQVWLATIAAGGTTSVLDLEAFLFGLTSLPPAQQDVLASTLNERLADLCEAAQVPYLLAPEPPPRPAEDPLAVLEEHLRAARGTTLASPAG